MAELGLADLYGPFGDTVGKLVGQYSDSDRVSQSRQSLPKGARGFGALRVQRGEREGRVLAGEARLSRGESLRRQGPEEEGRQDDSQPGANWDSICYCTCVYTVLSRRY